MDHRIDHHMNSQPTDIRDQAEDLLLAHGTIPTSALLDGVEHLAETRGFEIAADMLATLVSRLDVRQRALWTGLIGTSDPLAQMAPSLGITPQALHRQQQRLEKRLMPRPRVDAESNTASGPCRPNQVQTRSKGRRTPRRPR